MKIQYMETIFCVIYLRRWFIIQEDRAMNNKTEFDLNQFYLYCLMCTTIDM